jgi:putative endopeptidase
MEQKVNAFDFADEFLDKLNTPKDKTKWEMSPQTVNAYFHPLNNEIVFPAAIIQAPFFHKTLATADFEIEADVATSAHALSAVNFGAIGAVIAHEITHGYDDQGRRFDEDGNSKDWWQPEDATLFEEKTKVMGSQAAQYVYTDKGGKDHKLNPELTMGENLADLGGMSLAYQALTKRVRAAGVAADSAEELGLARLFFRSWASIWKEKASEEDRVSRLASDPHSPNNFRGNLCKNIDGFYKAFNIPEEGHVMSLKPDARVRMW